MSEFVDAHCHLTDDRVWEDAQAWIDEAKLAGVRAVRLGGLYPAEWARQRELQKNEPRFIRSSFGIHPWWVEKFSKAELDEMLLKLEAALPSASAIGETGLDFFSKRDVSRFADQEYYFRAQLALAKKANKSVVLHIVSAHERALEIIAEENAELLRFQVHSFSGSKEQAVLWVKIGAYISFNGSLVKSNRSAKMAEILKTVPLNQVLFETDAPDQAWHANRQNHPSFVGEIYKKAAQVLDLTLPSLCQIVAENFNRFG